uniref:Protein kish-B n=1 Tax=Melopsittacus undulatus TaxID=13146 RepID=A0A8V5GS52_MELUD
MTNVYSLDGLVVFALLLVCTCAHLRHVPRIKGWLLGEKRGLWGVFYKGQGVSMGLVVGGVPCGWSPVGCGAGSYESRCCCGAGCHGGRGSRAGPCGPRGCHGAGGPIGWEAGCCRVL